MLKPKFTGQFKKDYKLAIKRGCKQEAIAICFDMKQSVKVVELFHRVEISVFKNTKDFYHNDG